MILPTAEAESVARNTDCRSKETQKYLARIIRTILSMLESSVYYIEFTSETESGSAIDRSCRASYNYIYKYIYRKSTAKRQREIAGKEMTSKSISEAC